MSGRRIVWVVENGVYSGRYIEGVYWTIEDVIAANPPREPQTGNHKQERAGGWQPSGEPNETGLPHWDNGLDWHDLLEATPIFVDGTLPSSFGVQP